MDRAHVKLPKARPHVPGYCIQCSNSGVSHTAVGSDSVYWQGTASQGSFLEILEFDCT